MIQIKTKINKVDADWVNIKNKCRTTVNKEYTGNEPSSLFKRKLLLSEHSPIRLLRVDWSWKGIKSWVSVHWVRHMWESFVSTQRSDRTGINRDELTQAELVNLDGEANAQNLIDTMRKRLCYQAAKDTRESAEDLKIKLYPYEPELADMLVPNCIYRCGCPEFESCGLYQKVLKDIDPNDLYDIMARNMAYNEWLLKKYKK